MNFIFTSYFVPALRIPASPNSIPTVCAWQADGPTSIALSSTKRFLHDIPKIGLLNNMAKHDRRSGHACQPLGRRDAFVDLAGTVRRQVIFCMTSKKIGLLRTIGQNTMGGRDMRVSSGTRISLGRRAALIGLVGTAASAATSAYSQVVGGDPMKLIALPPRVAAAVEYAVKIPGGSLWVRDVGGTGPVVIFLHPYSGSYESWQYQEGAFAHEGFRVVTYSRRGYRGSSRRDGQVSDSGDLAALVDQLSITRFHAIGAAAGGGVAANFAIRRQGGLISLVIVGSILGIQDPAYIELGKTLRPPEFDALPAHLQELGPSYRVANAEGVKEWIELHDRAWLDHAPPAYNAATVTWSGLAALRIPTLFLTGDADLFAPPALVRMFAARIEGSELALIADVGHSPAWERPDIFNETVIAFLKKHR
jgi:pimeloyl-ACP methyl ester carboxylesterase